MEAYTPYLEEWVTLDLEQTNPAWQFEIKESFDRIGNGVHMAHILFGFGPCPT